MAKKPVITPELLRQLIRFVPETEQYFWNPRPTEFFASERLCKAWNAAFANKEAFTSVDGRGYCQVCVLGRNYNAHRVIWLYHYGEWPNGAIDHINGNKRDNRISNLRDVSQAENNKNMKRRSDNTSGCSGVHWNKLGKNWRVRISVSGRSQHIGCFTKFSDAVAAANEARARYGFHNNHGRF